MPTDADIEIMALKEENETLRVQYSDMFARVVKAGEKINALEEANAWGRSRIAALEAEVRGLDDQLNAAHYNKLGR